MNTAIVVGVGPDRGLGAQLCRRFAGLGLKVLVAGRTKETLDAVVANIEADGGAAEAVVTDATDERQVRALFDAAGDDLSLAIYNAGNNAPGRIAEMDAEYFETAWRLCCFGGFLVGREAVRRFLAREPVPLRVRVEKRRSPGPKPGERYCSPERAHHCAGARTSAQRFPIDFQSMRAHHCAGARTSAQHHRGPDP